MQFGLVRKRQMTGAHASELPQVAQYGAPRREDVVVLRQCSQKPRRAVGAVPWIVRQVIHAPHMKLANLFECGLFEGRNAGGQQPFWLDVAARLQHLGTELLQSRRTPSVKPPIDTVLPESPVVCLGQVADDGVEAQRFGGGPEMRPHVDWVRVANQQQCLVHAQWRTGCSCRTILRNACAMPAAAFSVV